MPKQDTEPGASRLVRFYQGRVADDRGRYIDQILMFSDTELEHTHDYIQWLFPLSSPSAFHLSAPTLTAGDIQLFRSDKGIQNNMERAFERMLAFYGFVLVYSAGRPTVRQSNYWAEHSRRWLDPYNHNYLRITRILKSLSTSGFHPLALAFYEALRSIHHHGPEGQIPDRTMHFWKDAVAQTY